VEVIRTYGELPLVACQSGHLSQVFMNLLANAVDALLEVQNQIPPLERQRWQPTIMIRTQCMNELPADLAAIEPASIAAVEPRTMDVTGWVMVEIADNGPGIPEAIQTKIFETFFTTKPIGKGTGLGLAITHEIIARHGGHLRLRSPRWPETYPDRPFDLPGTSFEVWLPLTAEF
jgi:signal transduction histidine kinase